MIMTQENAKREKSQKDTIRDAISEYEKRFIVWLKWQAKKSLISKPSTITNLVSSILNYYQFCTTNYSTAKLIR